MIKDNNKVEYLSEEKRKELKAELVDLKTTKRKEILEKLKFAKSLGDLSENAEYHQAREDQAKLEERISQIEYLIRTSIVVQKKYSDIANIGSTVVVKKEGSKTEQTFHIVGSEEVNMDQGKISNKSPLGEALFGSKKGDIVVIKTPEGSVKYKILDIK